MEIIIELRKVDDEWHAQISGDKRYTNVSGKSKAEAVGNLILQFSGTFNLVIEEH